MTETDSPNKCNTSFYLSNSIGNIYNLWDSNADGLAFYTSDSNTFTPIIYLSIPFFCWLSLIVYVYLPSIRSFTFLFFYLLRDWHSYLVSWSDFYNTETDNSVHFSASLSLQTQWRWLLSSPHPISLTRTQTDRCTPISVPTSLLTSLSFYAPSLFPNFTSLLSQDFALPSLTFLTVFTLSLSPLTLLILSLHSTSSPFILLILSLHSTFYFPNSPVVGTAGNPTLQSRSYIASWPIVNCTHMSLRLN